MADDYQLRKELDNYKWLFDELIKELERQGVVNISELLDKFYDQSEVDVQYTTFSNHLSEFSTRLTTLLNSLKDFNGTLIDFSDDNENLEDDLTKLKDNLLEFLDVLGLLDIDLIQLKGQMDTLELQMNGDTNTDGFVDFIQELQNNIYGANETYTDNQGNTQHYTINNPSPNSLKGTLQSFGTQLGSLSVGDTKLALTLSSVTGYLTNFKGTLAELQAQIVEDYGQSFYDGLDVEIIKLIGAITNANDEIDNHQGLIEGVQGTIGTEGDENTPSTGLFAKLDNVSETADGAVATSDALMDTLYKKATLAKYTGGTSYSSSSLVVNTNSSTGVTTFSTQNNTYGIFVFSSTTSISDAYYVSNGQGFEFTITGHTGKTTVRFDKSDGTQTNLFNSDADSDYFENNNYIKIIHTGTSAEVYVNNYLMKTVTLTDARRLLIRVENGGTFSFKDLHQISVTGTDDNPANGSVINGLNTVKDTDIPAVKNKMGYNDIPANTTLQDQLDVHDEQIGDVPTGKSLQGQIGTVPNGKTIQGQIGNVPSGTSLQGQIGTVDVTNEGTLQDQLTAQSGIIGGDSDTGSDGTLFGLINKSIADIGDEEEGTGVLGDAKRLKDLSYGYSDGGTVSNPSSNSIMGQTTTLVEESIPTLQEDIYGGEGYSISSPSDDSLQGQIIAHDDKIGNVPSGQTLQGQIGTVDVTNDGDLQTQINGIKSVIQNNNENQAIWVISDSTPSQQEWLILMYDYCVDIDNIHYAYSIQNNKAFIRNRSSWEEYDIEQLVDEVDFICGISYDIRGNISTVTEYETWDLMLSCRYDIFYIKEDDEWVGTNAEYPYARNSVYVLTDWLSGSFQNIIVGDNKNQHRINREIDVMLGVSSYTLTNWETTNFSTCDVTFHKQLNMVTCIYHLNTATFSNTSDHTVTASEIPSTYRPPSTFYQDICTYRGQKLDGLLTVGTDGSMKIRMGTANTSMNIYGSFTYIVE